MSSRISFMLVIVSIGLSGCVAAAVNTSTFVAKGLPRSELRPKAEAGDAIAQYKLGKSYCCMGPGFDTQTATEWFCKAAFQGNSDAMYELGRVYLGRISRTPAPGQKLHRLLSAKKSAPHAHLWLSKAASLNHGDAQNLLAKLITDINQDDLSTAHSFALDWRNISCEYDDVFDS